MFLAKIQTGKATNMPDENIKYVPIKDLRQEPGAEELASSAEMRPYIEFAMAVMKGADPTPQLETIRQLPLEKRYVWRIVSALKWGFSTCMPATPAFFTQPLGLPYSLLTGTLPYWCMENLGPSSIAVMLVAPGSVFHP
jgi:hypothetical protein